MKNPRQGHHETHKTHEKEIRRGAACCAKGAPALFDSLFVYLVCFVVSRPVRSQSSFASLRVFRGSRSSQSGFALVITVVLLALLVLAVYSLATLSRVGADVSATGNYHVQARQHALLGRVVALPTRLCRY